METPQRQEPLRPAPQPRSNQRESWKDLLRKRWWKPERVLTIIISGGISILLGAIALGVAIRTETHTLPLIDQYIKTELSSALTTRSVGVFPGNMPAVLELMKSVEDNGKPDTLHIVCDMVAYGIMSNPEAYDLYRRRLTSIATDTSEVVMLQPYDAARREEQFDDQFKKEKDSVDSMRVFLNGDKYKRFFHYWKNKKEFADVWLPSMDTSYVQFKARIMAINESELKSFRANNIRIDEEPLRSNVFLWRHNHENVVFSLYNNAIEYSPQEVSISTRDVVLIRQILAQMPKFDFGYTTVGP